MHANYQDSVNTHGQINVSEFDIQLGLNILEVAASWVVDEYAL